MPALSENGTPKASRIFSAFAGFRLQFSKFTAPSELVEAAYRLGGNTEAGTCQTQIGSS